MFCCLTETYMLCLPTYCILGRPAPCAILSSLTHYRIPSLCQVSAKLILHSAKALLSAALGKVHTVKKVTAKKTLSSTFSQALGKVFAVY